MDRLQLRLQSKQQVMMRDSKGKDDLRLHLVGTTKHRFQQLQHRTASSTCTAASGGSVRALGDAPRPPDAFRIRVWSEQNRSTVLSVDRDDFEKDFRSRFAYPTNSDVTDEEKKEEE